MKGMIFTEFLEMVEEHFSPEVADRMIEACDLPSGGVYTAVGTYAPHEMVQLVTQLSEETGIAVPDLLRSFGKHLFGRFVGNYAQFFGGVNSAFSFWPTLKGTSTSRCGSCIPMPSFPALHAPQSHGG